MFLEADIDGVVLRGLDGNVSVQLACLPLDVHKVSIAYRRSVVVIMEKLLSQRDVFCEPFAILVLLELAILVHDYPGWVCVEINHVSVIQ